jgi:hypothetical protein
LACSGAAANGPSIARKSAAIITAIAAHRRWKEADFLPTSNGRELGNIWRVIGRRRSRAALAWREPSMGAMLRGARRPVNARWRYFSGRYSEDASLSQQGMMKPFFPTIGPPERIEPALRFPSR